MSRTPKICFLISLCYIIKLLKASMYTRLRLNWHDCVTSLVSINFGSWKLKRLSINFRVKNLFSFQLNTLTRDAPGYHEWLQKLLWSFFPRTPCFFYWEIKIPPHALLSKDVRVENLNDPPAYIWTIPIYILALIDSSSADKTTLIRDQLRN